jgi:hypothetical protein
VSTAPKQGLIWRLLGMLCCAVPQLLKVAYSCEASYGVQMILLGSTCTTVHTQGGGWDVCNQGMMVLTCSLM